MTTLSQSLIRLSMRAQCCLAMMALAAPALAGGAAATSSRYHGRWTVSEDRPVFTARGRLYKTIDVAPCGDDFCGVSVGDKGACGAVLFRFLGRHAGTDLLRGHGKWGEEQKNIVIYGSSGDEPGAAPQFTLYLGDGHDFGERSGNMPKFHALYRRLGSARCQVR
jgi:hypothetical protein